MCEQWRAVEQFIADMGLRPSPKHSLDRIDCNGNYEPRNCRWATTHEQSANRRHVRRYEHMGISDHLPGWARRLGIKKSTLEQRIYTYGWTIERALTYSNERT